MAFFNLRWQDFLDILIVAFLIYRILLLLVGTRAMQLIRGLMIIGLIGAAANLLDLRSLSNIMGRMIGALIIIIPILFQPELRRMLEELGKIDIRIGSGSSTQEIDQRAEQLTKALLYCQSQRIGALVVLQRDTSLKDVGAPPSCSTRT